MTTHTVLVTSITMKSNVIMMEIGSDRLQSSRCQQL